MRKEKGFITEKEKLEKRLNLTHTERFYLLMRIIKLTRKLQKAKINYPVI
jgi:hypothetical protein